MDLSSRFKKDYFNYLISIILPALINAISIPLFKNMLGPEGYGHFALTFNSLLLFTALLTGWITQSIIRYFPLQQNKTSFTKQALLLSGITQLIFFTPMVVFVFYLKHDLLLAFFLGATLLVTSLQFTILALSQSVFLSKKSIYSELIRTVSYITIVVLLLTATLVYYMYALFTAIFISYLLSFLYLLNQTKKQMVIYESTTALSPPLFNIFKSFLSYGGPLSLYFVVNASISLADKYFMLHTLGAEVHGNYQAMYDLLSKSITMLVSPATISLFPLLTAAYQTGKRDEIRKLFITIIGFEFAGLILAVVMYCWFGADILSALIKVPNTTEYKIMGVLVITGTFLWQIALIVHKPHELKFRSWFLLGMIAIAFVCQLIIYLLFHSTLGKLLYPLGYVASALIYLMLISAQRVKALFNKSHQEGIE